MLTMLTRRALLVGCALLASGAVAVAEPTTTPSPVPTVWSGEKPPAGLSGGAASIDALLDQFLAAVTAGDLEALNRLRVTDQEYGSIIVPGMVAKGEPPRATFEKVNSVFFGMLNTRSHYAAQALIDRFKGKTLTRRELSFTKGVQDWAWYTARGDTFLVVTDEQGERYEFKTGWIAEVDGRFKFIGFNWDN